VSNPPPVITAVGALDTTVECHTSYVDQGATASDACQGPVAVSSSSNLDVNTVGTYVVTYGAADRAGNQAAPVSRTVHVADTTAPVVALVGPAAMAVECATAFSDPGATASDSCAGTLPLIVAGAVDTSTVGTYGISYGAKDPSGNAAIASRVVTVADTTAPVIAIAGANPATVECATAYADPGATASDACAGVLPVAVTGSVNVGTVGSYALGYSTTDPSGNAASATRAVVVADHTAPQLTVTAGGSLWPANHKYTSFAVADMVGSASDACDGTVGVGRVVITQVTSDEAANGKGDGNTGDDIVVAADCRSVQLRAERQGGGNGRVYTVTLRVTDASGNAATQSVKVSVPASGNGAPAVDDGPAYTVASSCR
jgi:hypothetical protein